MFFDDWNGRLASKAVRESITKSWTRNRPGSGEVFEQLKSFAAFAMDLSVFPRTHVGWLTRVSNSNSMGYDTIF